MRSSPRRVLAAILGLIAAACGGAASESATTAGPPMYVGDLACADCSAIGTALTLFPGDTFLLEETYRGTKDGDHKYTSRGAWASMADASAPGAGRIVLLSPNQGPPRRFRQLGDSALRQLDRDGKEFESAANMILRRQP